MSTGGRYDPLTDSWTATSTDTNVPSARFYHTALWTGTKMIVWGGWIAHNDPTATGGLYDPASDGWIATPVGANTPAPRVGHTIVWTGTEMIVWGGGIASNTWVATGGRFNPASGGWTTTTMTNAPAGRGHHSAVWTGTEMIVWGGLNGPELDTGARYVPATDTWVAATALVGAPAPRRSHSAVWTGTEMIVWGGQGSSMFNSGGRYDPSTNRWLPTPTGAGVPTGRHLHTAVSTGAEMIVWGGTDGSYLVTGGRYDPSTNGWTPTSTGPYAPSPRGYHTAVWTGTEMIVWGGYNSGTLNTGGRYNPSTDSWTQTSTGGSFPSPREAHSVVWTGSEMIVWGGYDNGARLGTGGRYDPSTNGWTPTATSVLAPSARAWHTAVWTGTEMIVWGGKDSDELNTGGRYDPAADVWQPTSTGSGSPAARRNHTAVRIGTQVIVWGGYPHSNDVYLYCACAGIAYRDVDDDGHGNPDDSVVTSDCALPAGYAASSDDCDDTNPTVYTGAQEVCDGLDNDCNTLIDDGIAPPVTHPTVDASRSGETVVLSWPATPDATHYDAAKGALVALRSRAGDFTTSTTGCLEDDLDVPSVSDDAPTSLEEGFWYLVRPVSCGGNGTYQSGGPQEVEGRDAEIAASGADCP